MAGEVDQTLWVGNLNDKISEELLWELFLQSGPLMSVKIATEKDGRKKNFAFVRFKHAESVPYTIGLMNGIRLHGNSLRLQTRPGSIHDPKRQNSMNGSLQMAGGFHRSHSAPDFGNQWGPGTPPPPTGNMGPPGPPLQFSTPNMVRGDTYPQGSGPDRSRSHDRNRDAGGRHERSRSPHSRGRYDERYRDSPPTNDRHSRSGYDNYGGARSRSGSRDDDFEQQRQSVLAAQQMAMRTNRHMSSGQRSPWELAQTLHSYNQQDRMQPRHWQGNNRRKY